MPEPAVIDATSPQATIYYSQDAPSERRADTWPAELSVPEHGQTLADGRAALKNGWRSVKARGGPFNAIRTYTRRASGAYVERGSDERNGLHLRLGG